MTYFKYLDCISEASDDDWLGVVGNLQKKRKKWARMLMILRKQGGDSRISGTFFKAVVQVVLIFGYETWVLTPHMVRMMRGFQHRVARWLTGKQPRQPSDGEWDYPTLG